MADTRNDFDADDVNPENALEQHLKKSKTDTKRRNVSPLVSRPEFVPLPSFVSFAGQQPTKRAADEEDANAYTLFLIFGGVLLFGIFLGSKYFGSSNSPSSFLSEGVKSSAKKLAKEIVSDSE